MSIRRKLAAPRGARPTCSVVECRPLESRRLLSLVGAQIYTDPTLATVGLVGSYVDRSLNTYRVEDDWRISQTIAGTRIDPELQFLNDGWGARAAVGLTGGSDDDWDRFSAQWDGVVKINAAGQRLSLMSDEGSRAWIDLNQSGTFESAERIENGWGRNQWPANGERTAGLAVGVYALRVQFYDTGGQSKMALTSSPWIPRPFVPTPTNPRQTVRVIVLNFDPLVPSEQNRPMHEVFAWSDPHSLAVQYERDLEWATGGAIDVQVVEWRELNEFPTFTDGFRYNPDEYVANRRTNSGWHNTGTDFYTLVESQNLRPLVNAGAVDEIWTFGDHYFDILGEAWMGGPGSFFVNGPSFSDAGFDRAIAGMGFSYERAVGEMLHNLSHRTENHGQRAFGSWNLSNPVTVWDHFSSNYLETTSGPYGVGTCHVPANADGHYNYDNTRVVTSTAGDFVNYPNLTGATAAVGRDTWGMGPLPDYHRDYLDWYFGMMPRNDGSASDGRLANWYKYIWDFNSYEPGTGLPRNEDAFGAGPIIRKAGGGSYDFTVRYYDQSGIDITSLGAGDVRVTGPGGFDAPATLVDVGAAAATTAGTARTVTYRITPPGGTWDLNDAGTYRINMQAGQVRDTVGNYVPAGEVGQFRVAIADPRDLNVRMALSDGSAAVDHTQFDIGSIDNLFDGNTSTLVRTPNIDPAVVTLSYDTAQTVSGFRTYFSYASGNPAIRWTVEAADTLADLNAQSGTYRLLVPLTGTPIEQYSTVMLNEPATARLFRLTATKLYGDDFVHMNEWQLISNLTAENDAPAATMTPIAGVTTHGGTSQFINVSYTDASGVVSTSLDSGDVLVTGPNGFTVAATFYDVSSHLSGQARTGAYWIIPPGGAWDHTDSGVYTVTLQHQQVYDVWGNTHAAPIVLGTFTVNIPAPQARPPADMTELNADHWIAWADGATASTSDDPTRRVLGAASVRFETTGGFDTLMRYNPPNGAAWDLSDAEHFYFSVYAQNANGFQNGSPWIRIIDAEDDVRVYQYFSNGDPYDLLNDAIGQWVPQQVPLDASTSTQNGWRTVQSSGVIDWNRISTVEFHADTWDHGFVLWWDRVGFDLPVQVIASDYRHDRATPAVSIQFDESVAASLEVGDFAVVNLATGAPVWPAAMAVGYVAATNTAELTFPGLPLSSLPDGNYRLTLAAAGVTDVAGNPLGTDHTLDFFVLAGDADRDRTVGIGDFSILASRFNQPGTFSQGDFNYSGTVEIGDFSIMASKFNTSLPPARAGGVAPAAPTVLRPITEGFSNRRVVDLLEPGG